MCRASGAGLTDAYTNELAMFNIYAVDSAGSPKTKGGDDFKVYVSGPNNTRIYGTVADNGDGTYTASYTPPIGYESLKFYF